MDPNTDSRVRRRWRLWLAGTGLVFAVLVGGVFLVLPRIAEGVLVAGLESAQVPNPELHVTDVGWRGARIADLRLGAAGELTVEEIAIDYTPADLLRRRLDHVTLRGLHLTLDLGGDGPPLGSLEAPLQALVGGPDDGENTPLPDITVEDSRLTLTTRLGPVTIPVAGEIATAPDGQVLGRMEIPSAMVQAADHLSGTLRGGVRFALDQAGVSTLSADLVAADLAWATAMIERAVLDLELNGNHGTGRLTIAEASDRLTLQAELETDDVFSGGGGAVAARIEGDAAADSALWPLLGLSAPTEDRAGLAADLTGGLSLDAGTFAIDHGEVVLTGLVLADTAFEPITLRGILSGRPDRFSGTLSLAAGVPALNLPSLEAAGVTVSADAEVTMTEGRFAATLSGDGITVQKLAASGLLTTTEPLRLPLAPDRPSSVSIVLSGPDGVSLDHDIIFGPADLTARLQPDAPESLPVAAGLPSLALAGHWTSADGYQGNARLVDGTVHLPEQQILARDIDAEIALPGGDAPIALRLAEARIAHDADPAPFAPLQVQADAQLAGARLDFTLRASAASDRARLTVVGRHDLGAGTGAAAVDLPTVTFDPDELEAGDLLPVLNGRIEQATGTVGLAGDISWTRNGTASDLQLLLKDLSFTTPQAEIVRINGVVQFDSVLPLSTPPGQRLAVGLIDVGVPLTDGLLAFELRPDDTLAVESGRLRLAGGEVTLEPAVIDFAAAETALRLDITDLSLTGLLALADIDGLSATGRLDGRIPVGIGEGVVVSGGVLEADAPGRLSYAPARPPAALQAQGETVSLLLSALTNFEYDELRLTVDRTADGEMVVAVHIEGKNPGFYDGYPVELNFNISGELDQVLHRSLVGYRIPDIIRERLSEFPE